MRKMTVMLFAAAALAGFSGIASAAPAPKMPFNTMAELPIVEKHVYDEDANADKVVDDALAHAKKNKKLLLIDLGGNWCPDCRVLAGTMALPQVKAFIGKHYELVMVDVGRFDRNLQIPGRYGIARPEGVPALLIIDPKTNRLLNPGKTSALSNARAMTPQALADWLASWTK